MGAKFSFGRTIGILIVLLQTYGYRLVCDAASTLDACVLKNGEWQIGNGTLQDQKSWLEFRVNSVS